MNFFMLSKNHNQQSEKFASMMKSVCQVPKETSMIKYYVFFKDKKSKKI